jgi:BirA family biotin operon repressor/biotin-[acetyl-CoA-carboxylase] ligase
MAAMFSVQELKIGLRTSLIGHRILYYATVGSTNDVVRALAVTGAPEGIVVVADAQTAGRGRKGRHWLAPAGTCLLFSLLLRPPLLPQHCQRLTMACSLALAEAVEAHTRLPVGLKWPNDLLIRGRKVGGILMELGIEGGQLQYAIVGIGLNVNPDFATPEMASLAGQATSLAQEKGLSLAREALLASILNQLEKRYARLCDGWSPHKLWEDRLTMLGRQVALFNADGRLEGWAEGVDPDGALLLRLEDGRTVRVLAGDVSLRPAAGDRSPGCI